jgi:hypothetical protein
MMKLFNLFKAPRTPEFTNADLDAIKMVLANIQPAIQAAKLAREARKYERDAAATAGLTAEEEEAIRPYQGELGVGLAVYTDASDKIHKVAALNDVGLKPSPGMKKKKQEERTAKSELIWSAYAKIYNKLEANLKADGYEIVLAGGIDPDKAPQAAGHEEIFIRNYLSGVVSSIVGTVVPIGVSQNTVCGRCVHHLLTGHDLMSSAEPGGAKQSASMGEITPELDQEKVKQVIVLGNSVAEIIGK